jgi:hypothetical protein
LPSHLFSLSQQSESNNVFWSITVRDSLSCELDSSRNKRRMLISSSVKSSKFRRSLKSPRGPYQGSFSLDNEVTSRRKMQCTIAIDAIVDIVNDETVYNNRYERSEFLKSIVWNSDILRARTSKYQNSEEALCVWWLLENVIFKHSAAENAKIKSARSENCVLTDFSRDSKSS